MHLERAEHTVRAQEMPGAVIISTHRPAWRTAWLREEETEDREEGLCRDRLDTPKQNSQGDKTRSQQIPAAGEPKSSADLYMYSLPASRMGFRQLSPSHLPGSAAAPSRERMRNACRAFSVTPGSEH